MQTALVIASLWALSALTLSAAELSPQETVTRAAQALGEKPNYAWRTTTVVPDSSPFRPGPWEGKTERNGPTWVKMTFGENTSEFVLKGDSGAALTPDGGWQSLSELENAEGPGRFLAILIRDFKAPARQAAQLAGYAKDLKRDGDAYVGALTEEGAKELLTWRPRAGGEGPQVSGAQGSVKFWVRDGVLSQYEFKLKGTVSFNGNSFENDRTTTVVVREVGTTTLTLPEAALKKLS